MDNIAQMHADWIRAFTACPESILGDGGYHGMCVREITEAMDAAVAPYRAVLERALGENDSDCGECKSCGLSVGLTWDAVTRAVTRDNSDKFCHNIYGVSDTDPPTPPCWRPDARALMEQP